MRTTLTVLSLAAGIGLVCCQNALAFPAAAGAIQESATATSELQHAQFSERHHRGAVSKCYREFVIGNYVCHTYRNW
jgi:hypothetical protein